MFVHTALIPPGCGIGLHGHTACEEMGITVGGGMQFGHNGRVRQCASGAAAPCRKGECHSLYNHTTQPTRWFSVKVAFEREPSTCGQQFDGPADAHQPLDTDADITQTPMETPDAEQVPLGRLLPRRSCPLRRLNHPPILLVISLPAVLSRLRPGSSRTQADSRHPCMSPATLILPNPPGGLGPWSLPPTIALPSTARLAVLRPLVAPGVTHLLRTVPLWAPVVRV